MQKIPLMLAKAGMILTRDVYRSETFTGMPICGKGTELTDALITRFEMMDVQAIHVDGQSANDKEIVSLDNLLHDLDSRFSKTIHEPLNAKLYEVYKSYLTKTMGGDGE